MIKPPLLTTCTGLVILIGLLEFANTTDSKQQAKSTRSIYYENDAKFGNKASATAAGYLFSALPSWKLDMRDPLEANLSRILDKSGSDMRPSRDCRDFDDISVDMSKRAWNLMHYRAVQAITDRVELVKPAIVELLLSAEVSHQCRQSVNQLFDGAKRLESWAIKLINSWGNFPPVGLFEGTYSEMGSFHSCVKIPENQYIDHAHYCSLTFRPVLPTRKDYEIVLRKEPDELLHLFDSQQGLNATRTSSNLNEKKFPPLRDAFQDLLEHAQYNHYVYYKIGTCWPIQCSPFDVRRVVKLLAKRNILTSGPVKCYSKFQDDYEQIYNITAADLGSPPEVTSNETSTVQSKKLLISVWDLNDGIFIWKPHFNQAQRYALAVLVLVATFMVCMSSIDLIVNRIPYLWTRLLQALSNKSSSSYRQTASIQVSVGPSDKAGVECSNGDLNLGDANVSGQVYKLIPQASQVSAPQPSPELETEEKSAFMTFVNDCSIFTNCGQFFRIGEGQLKNDILCLNGIRCLTMIWIIMTHTMMYNDWSAFARTREIENSLKSIVSQPVFNGSYLVDTFFFMSGLLSAFTAFKHSKGLISKFNSVAFILGRWLRLTPQIFLCSMMYIVLPALSYGPHWFPIVGEYSENCVENWWINVLHLQAFYKSSKMCNFVTWWISIDFFYHFVALAAIWILLSTSHKLGFVSIAVLVASQVAWQTFRHYQLSLPPNVFSTIPQTGSMWTEMTLSFYWTPYTHAVPFFFGFYVGYLMASKRKLILRYLNTRICIIGWTLATTLLIGQSYSTYWWVTGQANYSRLVSTIFYTVCPLIWTGSLCWIVLACHHGYGGFINDILSSKVFIVLGKASYLVYLSHFQVLFMFFGNQSLLLEPSELVMFYIVLGNIFISTLFGIVLCIVFEIPWLKVQRKLMKYI